MPFTPAPGEWGFLSLNKGGFIDLWVIDAEGKKHDNITVQTAEGRFYWIDTWCNSLLEVVQLYVAVNGLAKGTFKLKSTSMKGDTCRLCNEWIHALEYNRHISICTNSKPYYNRLQTDSNTFDKQVQPSNYHRTKISSNSSTSSTDIGRGANDELAIATATTKTPATENNISPSTNRNVHNFHVNNPFYCPKINVNEEEKDQDGEGKDHSEVDHSNVFHSASSSQHSTSPSSSHVPAITLVDETIADMGTPQCSSQLEPKTSAVSSVSSTSFADSSNITPPPRQHNAHLRHEQTPNNWSSTSTEYETRTRATSTASSSTSILPPYDIPPPYPTPWKCKVCGGENPLFDTKCRWCHVCDGIGSSILVDYSSLDHKEIHRSFTNTPHSPFQDPDFPPNQSSLGDAMFTDLRWKRLSEMENKGQLRIFDEPQPSDITQGQLGNCWLMSALAVVATKIDVSRLVLSDGFSESGMYQVRLCRDGSWNVVTVDDYLPCTEDGELAFSPISRNQIWVPLVEKAMAKMYGSYHALTEGNVCEGFTLLTGAPCVSIKPEDGKWVEIMSYFTADCLLGASIDKLEKDREESYARFGLMTGHAYSILSMKQVGPERFVRLRNPLGCEVWKGRYSCVSHFSPAQLSELKKVDAGEFWMCWEDVCDFFSAIEICKKQPYCVRVHGEFANSCTGDSSVFHVVLEKNTHIDVTVNQRGDRDGGDGFITQDVGIALFKADDNDKIILTTCIGTLGERKLDHVVHFSSEFLDQGNYIVLPYSFHNLTNDNPRRRFVLSIHSGQSVGVNTLEFPSSEWSAAVRKMIRTFGQPKHQPMWTEHMRIFKMDNMILLENRDSHFHQNLCLTLNNPRNYQSSRQNRMCIRASTSPNCEQLVVCFTKIIGDHDSDGNLHQEYTTSPEQGSNEPFILTRTDIHHQAFIE
eukprot:m.112107 g.112107  ORF g.112107 m.112107 type:complete len:924 (+) comp9247_c1_seq1:121-2892(+)